MAKKKKEVREKPTWLKTSEKQAEKIIIELAKQGLSTEKIGLILRDQHGIPTTKIYGKKISQILKQNQIEPKSSLANAEENVEKVKQHFEKNKQDKAAKYALIKKTATAIKLRKYHAKKGNRGKNQ